MNPLSLILSGVGLLGNMGFPKRDPGMSIDTPQAPLSSDTNTQTGDVRFKAGAPGKGGINYGTGTYDPEQSSSILAEMKRFRDERDPNSDANSWNNHLNQAMIAGINNRHGDATTQMLNWQKNLDERSKNSFDMFMKMEEFKAGQRNQAIFNKNKEDFIKSQLEKKANAANGGGGGNGGSPQSARSVLRQRTQADTKWWWWR